MSENNEILCNEDTAKDTTPKTENGVGRVVVRRKRFKKSDILVFAICLLVSIVVWLYATNSQKAAEDKTKNDIENAVQSGVQSGINQTTEDVGDKESNESEEKGEEDTSNSQNSDVESSEKDGDSNEIDSAEGGSDLKDSKS